MRIKDWTQSYLGKGEDRMIERMSPFRVPGGGKLITGTFILNWIELERS